jgi:Cns1/TTC4 Wheel domain
MNPLNVKAWYRAAKASLSLDRIPEAEDACTRGLEVDPPNKSLLALQVQIKARKDQIAAAEAERMARQLLEKRKKEALQKAFETRNLPWKETGTSPDVQDATPILEDGFDPSSTMSVPILLLYPLASQTDLIKSASEDTALNEHLEYILPPPWDTEGLEGGGSYVQSAVNCFVATPSGGLSKIARKIQIGKLLRSGKVELIDGLLRIYVVPEKLAPGWIEEYKSQKQNSS